MVLVGPSLGAAVAIDIAVNHPEAVLIRHISLRFSNQLTCSEDIKHEKNYKIYRLSPWF